MKDILCYSRPKCSICISSSSVMLLIRNPKTNTNPNLNPTKSLILEYKTSARNYIYIYYTHTKTLMQKVTCIVHDIKSSIQPILN
jgi:hypothetical protein